MDTKNIFDKLFIFEIANNHMGDLKHGLRIIQEISNVTKGFAFRFAFKLQYRDLDTFIHPSFKGRQDIKYVRRFEETRLGKKELKILRDKIKSAGFTAICTLFDENSVDLAEEHGFDIIKVGSSSFTDWSLLERIVKVDRPVILSTGGVSLDDLDKVVSFFEHRKKRFCLMHCVSEYPTKKENLQLNQIDFMRHRYPGVPIGYSGHETPDNLDAIKIAVSKGATLFERHVGVETQNYKLNLYSSLPSQIKMWLSAAKEAFLMCGSPAETRRRISRKENEDLRGLKRGVFAARRIKKGERINLKNTFLAIPNFEKQLLANNLSKYSEFIAKKSIEKNEPVRYSDIKERNLRTKVLQIINDIKRIIIESKITLPDKLDFELSHHYGIENFYKFGAAIINCINREYCKKLIIMLPGQNHPVHYHKRKEETFHILYGDITLNLNGRDNNYKAGDMIIIERGVKHSFASKKGAVFEEISTTHFKEDSYYDDRKIIKNKDRKTEMTFWSDWLIKPIT
jgi:sialic acid synthase SpsE/mannose-6-phosphate isomerase-like protein (cupin superfamily)